MTKYVFSDTDIDHMIKLRTVDGLSIENIGKVFSVGYKPIFRMLKSRGSNTTNNRNIHFTEVVQKQIFYAYEQGIGADGIPEYLGLSCSDSPIIRLLKSKYKTTRNRSEQQQARMNRATPEQIAHLVKNAHIANTGRKVSYAEKLVRAKAKEGRVNPLSNYEPDILIILKKNFSSVIPSKAIDIYNADFAIGSVAVEVFGGGWSVSDTTRISRYIERTKKIGKLGFHTVFIVLVKDGLIGHADQLVRTINELRCLPTANSQYRVIWGNSQTSAGLCSDLDKSAFICPFINVRDRRTGKYISVPR